MKLKVLSVENKGNLEKETVWLDVLEDAAIHYYLLCDTTYTDDDHISNELRHTYWFPTKSVKKGDYIALHTKDGKNTEGANNRNSTTHHFYWKLGKTIWNKDGDCAVLFKIDTWKTTKA